MRNTCLFANRRRKKTITKWKNKSPSLSSHSVWHHQLALCATTVFSITFVYLLTYVSSARTHCVLLNGLSTDTKVLSTPMRHNNLGCAESYAMLIASDMLVICWSNTEGDNILIPCLRCNWLKFELRPDFTIPRLNAWIWQDSVVCAVVLCIIKVRLFIHFPSFNLIRRKTATNLSPLFRVTFRPSSLLSYNLSTTGSESCIN